LGPHIRLSPADSTRKDDDDGCDPILRMGSASNNARDGKNIAITDNDNYIVDLHFDETHSGRIAPGGRI
jgi:hypothetical protein